MKKTIALLLALALLLTAAGTALATDSKGGKDYNTGFIFKVSEEEADVEWANEELAKLKEAATLADYFGEADLRGGEAVNEFWPVIASGYEESMGEQEIKMTFATPYEKDTDVAVLLGFKANDSVEWQSFAGKVLEDSVIAFKLDPDTILRVQENKALLAIVSK